MAHPPCVTLLHVRIWPVVKLLHQKSGAVTANHRVPVLTDVDVHLTAHDISTALDVACMLGRATVAKLLLAHGAKTVASAPGQQPSLIAALERGNLAIAKVLVQNGADVNVGMVIILTLPHCSGGTTTVTAS
jgi:ankyrin repeat protein